MIELTLIILSLSLPLSIAALWGVHGLWWRYSLISKCKKLNLAQLFTQLSLEKVQSERWTITLDAIREKSINTWLIPNVEASGLSPILGRAFVIDQH